MVRQLKSTTLILAFASLALLSGCASKVKTTSFLHPDFDFSYVERVAVLPFENLSSDRDAGARATRLTITELLASGAVEVVEPGEVRAVLSGLPGAQTGRVVAPSSEQIVSMGEKMRVQAVVLGSVTQSEVIRSGAVGRPVVTIDLHLVETETGATIWAATHTEQGSSFGAKVLGTGGEPISATTRRCVKKLLKELVR